MAKKIVLISCASKKLAFKSKAEDLLTRRAEYHGLARG